MALRISALRHPVNSAYSGTHDASPRARSRLHWRGALSQAAPTQLLLTSGSDLAPTSPHTSSLRTAGCMPFAAVASILTRLPKQSITVRLERLPRSCPLNGSSVKAAIPSTSALGGSISWHTEWRRRADRYSTGLLNPSPGSFGDALWRCRTQVAAWTTKHELHHKCRHARPISCFYF